MNDNLRWKQRLQNLNKAFSRLRHACTLPEYNELEMAGLVQTYEFTFELCWKTLKDKLIYDGYSVNSPREAIRQAFGADLIVILIVGSRRWKAAICLYILMMIPSRKRRFP